MAEILAPCGSPEVLKAALRAGCDAVYLGGEEFSARQNAANFCNEDIVNAVYECHKRGVKVYRTINTVIFDEQMDKCIKAVEHCARAGVDGIITQDLALVEIVRKCCPDMHIHASTQMTIHTRRGMEVTKKLGFSRTVISRELPLDIIKELSALGIETEVFVHGALCMSVSGQCYMSAVVGSRSANRGLCAQACRLPCNAGGRGKDRYDLSLKDLSYCDELGEIVNAGVSSLKIEGRMKRPEYVAMAVDSCKKALAGEDYDRNTLEAVFSRNGFTNGYLRHKLGADMFGMRTGEDAAAGAKAMPKIHELYRYEDKRDTLRFKVTIKADEPVRITARDSLGSEVSIEGDYPQQALSRAIDEAAVIKQLSKLGDTIYSFGGAECDIDEGLFVSPGVLNELRRKVCMEMDSARMLKNSAVVPFTNSDITDFPEYKGSGQTIRVSVTNLEQLGAVSPEKVEMCCIPLEFAVRAAEVFPVEKLAVMMPRFTFDEEKQLNRLAEAKRVGITHLYGTNLAHTEIAKEFGMMLHAGFGFNLTNSCALNVAKELGAADAIVSFELKASQIAKLKKPMLIGVYAYGRLPLMMTVNCPISAAVGCKNCTHHITDRTGRDFPVKCSKREGYVEILNSELLYMADKLGDLRCADILMLDFTDETPAQVRHIIEEYENGGLNGRPDKITRGLYYRGVQ
ncbi:U32 family peptidase [Ruminococcus albus]|uniref:Putative protease n=1 Tax=Ruminococcus albus TaxID=1264 RepID=A0A1I1NVR7_RUMAL|nr:U32 family peptidase [Ruminococcus albus]SFD01525.1 putative protease [Ruminococcus albus]